MKNTRPIPTLRTFVALVCWTTLLRAPQAQTPVSPPLVNNQTLTLNVVVTDKSDKPIAGLSQTDFTITDNKQPAKIVSFHPHSTASLGSIPALSSSLYSTR